MMRTCLGLTRISSKWTEAVVTVNHFFRHPQFTQYPLWSINGLFTQKLLTLVSILYCFNVSIKMTFCVVDRKLLAGNNKVVELRLEAIV